MLYKYEYQLEGKLLFSDNCIKVINSTTNEEYTFNQKDFPNLRGNENNAIINFKFKSKDKLSNNMQDCEIMITDFKFIKNDNAKESIYKNHYHIEAFCIGSKDVKLTKGKNSKKRKVLDLVKAKVYNLKTGKMAKFKHLYVPYSNSFKKAHKKVSFDISTLTGIDSSFYKKKGTFRVSNCKNL